MMASFKLLTVLCAFVVLGLTVNGAKVDYRPDSRIVDHLGKSCTSGTLFSSQNCGYMTKCNTYTVKCEEDMSEYHEWLREPMDQGGCAAGEIFALIATLDDRRMAYGKMEGPVVGNQQSSVQQVLNCMSNAATLCDGASTVKEVSNYITSNLGSRKYGLKSELELPFAGKANPKKNCYGKGSVNFHVEPLKILDELSTDMDRVVSQDKPNSKNTESLKAHLERFGPTPIQIKVFESLFRYSSGLLQPPSADEVLLGEHSVEVVAFNREKELFTLKNSWGTSYGVRGHIIVEAKVLFDWYYAWHQQAGKEPYSTHKRSAHVFKVKNVRLDMMNKMQTTGTVADLNANDWRYINEVWNRRGESLLPIDQTYADVNTYAYTPKFAQKDAGTQMPGINLAIRAAVDHFNKFKRDPNNPNREKDHEKFMYRANYLLYGDMTIAAGRVYNLVLQVHKVKNEQDVRRQEFLGAFVMVTRVYLPFSSYAIKGNFNKLYAYGKDHDLTGHISEGLGRHFVYYQAEAYGYPMHVSRNLGRLVDPDPNPPIYQRFIEAVNDVCQWPLKHIVGISMWSGLAFIKPQLRALVTDTKTLSILASVAGLYSALYVFTRTLFGNPRSKVLVEIAVFLDKATTRVQTLSIDLFPSTVLALTDNSPVIGFSVILLFVTLINFYLKDKNFKARVQQNKMTKEVVEFFLGTGKSDNSNETKKLKVRRRRR